MFMNEEAAKERFDHIFQYLKHNKFPENFSDSKKQTLKITSKSYVIDEGKIA